MRVILYLGYISAIIVIFAVNLVAKKYIKNRWLIWLGYGIPFLAIAILLATLSSPYVLFSDFDKAYYPAGRLVIENPSLLYQPGGGIHKFVNIPIVAFLFTPFSYLNINQAHILLSVISIAAIIAIIYILIKFSHISGQRRLALLGLFVINGPLYYCFREGNTSHFILLFLLLGVLCIHYQREFWLGCLLAIGTVIKPPILLLAVYLAVRKRWMVCTGFAVSMLIIVGSSLLVFGLDLHITWYQECIQTYAGKPMAAYNVQSVDGFLSRFIAYNHLTNWSPLEVDWRYKLVRYALLALLLGISIWVCWKSKAPRTLAQKNLEFSIVICLSLLISPISWTHYYVYLLLPFGLYIGKQLAIPQGRLWSRSMLCSILLTSLPVNNIDAQNAMFDFWYYYLFVSNYFFGCLLLLGILLASRWYGAKHPLTEA